MSCIGFPDTFSELVVKVLIRSVEFCSAVIMMHMLYNVIMVHLASSFGKDWSNFNR